MAHSPLSDALRAQIHDLLAKHDVVLFMKGTRSAPQCGFSAQVVRILDSQLPSFVAVDVLSMPELREGIKAFSQWPTIPQLYIRGEFIGGCDIVRELHASGELQRLLGTSGGPAQPPPIVTATAAALEAIQAAAPDDGDPLHLQIDHQFHHELFFAPKDATDLEVRIGGPVGAQAEWAEVPLLIDPVSARVAHGVHIDFIAESAGQGAFKIQNPNQPPRVKSLSPRDLRALLDRGERIEVFDVRSPQERALAKLACARHFDEQGQAYLASLDRNAPIAFHCHHGMRSRTAAEKALRDGFKNVYNLEGGIDAWSLVVDASIPRY